MIFSAISTRVCDFFFFEFYEPMLFAGMDNLQMNSFFSSGSSSHLSRHQSDSDDGGKNEVTYVGERRSTNPMPARPSNTMKTNVPSSMTGMVSTAGLENLAIAA